MSYRTRSSPFLRTLVAVGAVLLGGLLPTAAASAAVPAGAPPAVPAAGAYFGAASWDPTTNAGITELEARAGRTMAVHRDYSMWDDPQPSAAVTDDVRDGRLPLLSVRPQLKNGTKLSWARLAAGDYDTAISAQATGLASLHTPVLLVFHHEADLQSGYGTATDFRAAFRHYVSAVRAAGATNVSSVVVLSAYRYGANIADWYPGDDVVDWVGADAYNFAACSTGRPPWRTLAQAAAKFYAWGAARGKPLVLAEWGSAEDPALAGRKAQWITEAGATMRSWPMLKAAAYFDEPGSCDWRLDSSSSSQAAFATLATSSWARPA